MEAHCARCGEPSSGRFCPECGAAVALEACGACGAVPTPGERYCTECGRRLGDAEAAGHPSPSGEGGGPFSGEALGGWIAGLLLVGMSVFIVFPVLQEGGGDRAGAPPAATGQQGAGEAPGPAPGVDLSSMTPREAADRLFDRVMQAAEMGDSLEAQSFLPMAIAAYDRARPLDADGLFHLSVLQRTAMDFEEARETARTGLEQHPDHLLLRSAAAEAAREAGDPEAAEEHYAHLLRVWDREVTRDLEEYEVHGPLLPQIRAAAREFLEDR